MDETAPAKPKHSGTETRQRIDSVRVRLTSAERQQVDAAAEKTGLTLGSYVRAMLFTGNAPRAVRSPSVDRKALAQFLAWLGRLNGNVYQISRAANFGEAFETQALRNALKEITEMRNAVMAALGREAV